MFAATGHATEEAILNAMLAAETMTGVDDARVFALPVDRVMEALQKVPEGAGAVIGAETGPPPLAADRRTATISPSPAARDTCAD